MSFPSFSSDKNKAGIQRFRLEYNGSSVGSIYAYQIRNPSVGSTRDPDLYRVRYDECSRGVRDSLADAVARWLNGNSQRFREQLIGSKEHVTADSSGLKTHLQSNVLFLSDPTIDEPIRVCYVPRLTTYPYAARRYSLAGYIAKLGIVSAIE